MPRKVHYYPDNLPGSSVQVTIEEASGPRNPHPVLRQLICDALMRRRHPTGCSKRALRHSIEKFYNCRLGTKFLEQLQTSLNRMLREKFLHRHGYKYALVHPNMMKSRGFRMVTNRPRCFCKKSSSPRIHSDTRSRSRIRSLHGSDGKRRPTIVPTHSYSGSGSKPSRSRSRSTKEYVGRPSIGNRGPALASRKYRKMFVPEQRFFNSIGNPNNFIHPGERHRRGAIGRALDLARERARSTSKSKSRSRSRSRSTHCGSKRKRGSGSGHRRHRTRLRHHRRRQLHHRKSGHRSRSRSRSRARVRSRSHSSSPLEPRPDPLIPQLLTLPSSSDSHTMHRRSASLSAIMPKKPALRSSAPQSPTADSRPMTPKFMVKFRQDQMEED